MGYKVEEDLLIAYSEHLLAQPIDTIVEKFGTYKKKSIEMHYDLSRPIISKKVRNEVEKFAEKQWFTKEEIAEAREKFEAKQARASSAPTGTNIGMKTRSVEVKKEKPSKIQFKRKGKVIEPPAPKAPITTGQRKKEKENKPTTDDEEETKFEGEKKALRASGKKSKVVGAYTIKSIKKLLTKPTPFENMLMHIKEYGILKGLDKFYDKFSEDEPR